MKRINAAFVAAVALTALLLTGCSNVTSSESEEKIDLSNAAYLSSLCGDRAQEVLDTVSASADAKPNSGRRNQLASLGFSDPKDDKAVAELVGTLEERVKVDCATMTEGGAGVTAADGSTRQLPLYTGNGTPVVVDSTNDPATPPLLDASLRYTNQTTDWAAFVKRVDGQQWFIDGVNARATETGFDWEDIKHFASTKGVEARVIKVFNMDITDQEARDMARPYIGDAVDKMHIIRYGNFVNTLNAGTKDKPKMGDYVDGQSMVRVALLPIVYNDKGEPIGLDTSKGSGVFVDCGNLHWVPPATWVCQDSSCTPPPPPPPPSCPPGTTGTPPNCVTPPPPCNPEVEKCWETNVTPPDGVTVQPNDPYEERPALPVNPAPVLPIDETPSSNSGAEGATPPDPNRPQPDAGTGTTPDGGTGGVNPDTDGGTNNGTNEGDPGNPFG